MRLRLLMVLLFPACGPAPDEVGVGVLRQPLPSTTLVISAVFGAGGVIGTGSTPAFRTDFVELHNVSGQPIALGPLTLQHAAFMGSNWQVADFEPTASVPAGGYHLVAFTSGMTTIGAPLPPPDTSNAFIDLARSELKLALVTGAAALGTTCPLSGAEASRVIDFVGSGTANCFEGAPAPPASVTAGLVRRAQGCLDTDRNADDFEALAPVPRNAAAPPIFCFPDGGSSAVPDAGAPAPDGGVDAGAVAPDAGPPPDAGSTRPDAGAPTSDAGSPVDAGRPPPDGGDVGDAGQTMMTDGGGGPGLSARSGCRCSSVDASTFFATLALASLLRRRSPRAA
ncbi:MAG: hypothetical protein JNJ54_15580 [Myxococcaceae bacterium]|nr:hypothetical protein [Myxococcaceae bacterium]